MNEQRTVGQCEVSERGIEKVIDVGDCGTYTTELVIPKETFIEAYKSFVEQLDKNKTSDNLTNGDMLRSVFKPYKILNYDLRWKDVFVTESDWKYGTYWRVLIDWWNAPYIDK